MNKLGYHIVIKAIAQKYDKKKCINKLKINIILKFKPF